MSTQIDKRKGKAYVTLEVITSSDQALDHFTSRFCNTN